MLFEEKDAKNMIFLFWLVIMIAKTKSSKNYKPVNLFHSVCSDSTVQSDIYILTGNKKIMKMNETDSACKT